MSFYSELEIHGSAPALASSTGERLSYTQLAAYADGIASHMELPRRLVFIFCQNSVPSVGAYLACLRAGHVPLLLDEKLEKGLARQLIGLYQPAYVAAPLGLPLEDIGEPVYGFGEASVENYTLLRTRFTRQVPMAPELALLLTTSGSTGSPKLVRQSAENIQSNAEAICEYLELDDMQKAITTLPMNYTYGLSILNSHMQAGACILLTDYTLMQRQFWEFFKQEGATSFGGVPYTYEMLRRLRFFKMDLPSLQYMTQAGGKLNVELTREVVEYCKATGRRFIVMYGQTEATARMSWLPWEKAEEKCGSMGVAIPGGKFRLIDVDGGEIAEAGKPGELVYEGPNVTLGYAEGPKDLAKPDENHGVLHTGDVAKRDAEGYYTIVGRLKRFIKVYGNRVNLDEVEQRLKQKGFAAAVTGVDDHLLAVTENAEEVEKIQKLLPQTLGLNPAAFTVLPVESIPKNESGKTVYKELLALMDTP